MNKHTHDERFNENYENLRNAIVGQACRDYIGALRTLKKNPKNVFAQARAEECEKYFRSERYAIMCNIEGEAIIEQCKKRAENSKTVFKPRYM